MKRAIKGIGMITMVTLLANCGGGGGSDDGGGHKPPSGVSLKLSGLNSMELALAETGASPLWKARMTVGGEERLNLKDASLAELQKQVESVGLNDDDQGTLELTVLDSEQVLATNLESVANQDPANQVIWTNECTGLIKPSFNVAELSVSNKDGKKTANLEMRLCDFAGILTVPSLTVSSHKKKQSKETVIYKCQFNIESVYSSDMTQYADVLCDYGYDVMGEEEAPAITVPSEFAPGSQFYEAHRLMLKDFDLDKQSSGRRYNLKTKFGSLPFGSHSACRKQKVDLFYNDSGEVKQTRATYKKHFGTDGDVTWVLENEDNLPPFESVLEYYRGAATNSRTVTVYRFCEWSPETMTGFGGETSRL